jgi:uncharacterized repeat protein (TIGR01451 family)
LALLATLLMAVTLVMAAPGDFEPQTGFEVDGNIDFDDLGGTYDWWDGVNNRPGYPPAILIADAHSKNVNDDYFSPAGKFDEPAGWSITEGSVGPGQNELTNVFVWAIAPGDVGNTDTWIVMGMERVKKSGTFALDFEFNQDPWGFGSLPHVGGPNRTPGDIAVGFELKGNPTSATEDLQVLIVQFYDLADPAPALCANTIGNGNKLEAVGVGTDDCLPYGDTGWYYRFLDNAAILASSGLGTATMNAENEGFPQTSFTPNGETYTSYDPQGNVDDYVGEFEFAEAAINLTALGLEPGCPGFGSVHAKSRSSLEVGSDLKDLAGPRSLPVQCYIEGYKYLDINGNGDRDAGEPGLNGWTINLSNGSSTITANDPNGDPGYYRFDNLADGTYIASEDCSDQGTGWVQTETTPTNGCGSGVHNFTINLANRVGVGDFGNGKPAIDISKTCTANVFVGDDIAYEITVSNVGNVDLSGVDVSDTLLGTLATNISLPVNGSLTLYPTYTATTAGMVYNNATASGDYASATVSAADDCTTTVYALTVTKNANTSFTRTYAWTIDKSVDQPGPITVAPGGSVDLNYTVVVDVADGYPVDSDWAVAGTITINNPAPMDASLASVSDVVSPDIVASVSCSSLIVPAGGSLQCSYGASLPDAATRTNTATATLNNNNGGTTDFSGDAPVNFANATITEVDEMVDVTDTFAGYLGTCAAGAAPCTFSYIRTYIVPLLFCGDITVDNTATFTTNDTGTTGSDDATVIINVPCLGCTPGFWQGGAGSVLWDEENDPQWTYGGSNPFIHTTLFNDFFNVVTDFRLDGLTMFDLISSGGTSDSARRAARDMVAAYLNESAFPDAFPADSLAQLVTDWYAAVAGGDAALDAFHNTVSGWNDPEPPGYCPLP